MVTKSEVYNTTVNWNHVNKVTEIRRTYELINPDGAPGVIFKMYKRSQFRRNGDPENPISKKYQGKLFQRMGVKDVSRKSHKDKKPKDVFRERGMSEMMKEREYIY